MPRSVSPFAAKVVVTKGPYSHYLDFGPHKNRFFFTLNAEKRDFSTNYCLDLRIKMLVLEKILARWLLAEMVTT